MQKCILDDVKENESSFRAEEILKAAYKKGYYMKEIKAKDGLKVRRAEDHWSCNVHYDHGARYFRL